MFHPNHITLWDHCDWYISYYKIFYQDHDCSIGSISGSLSSLKFFPGREEKYNIFFLKKLKIQHWNKSKEEIIYYMEKKKKARKAKTFCFPWKSPYWSYKYTWPVFTTNPCTKTMYISELILFTFEYGLDVLH